MEKISWCLPWQKFIRYDTKNTGNKSKNWLRDTTNVMNLK